MKLTAKIATGIALLGLAAPMFAQATPAHARPYAEQVKRQGRTEKKSVKRHLRHHHHARTHRTTAAAQPVK